MDFKKTNRRKVKPLLDIQNIYCHALQIYDIPPTSEITLDQFEEYAVERLKVLRVVESTGLKHPKFSEDYEHSLQNELKKLGLSHFLMRNKTVNEDDESSTEILNARKKDHISHYILRLSYCRSDALRKWFINQEVDLFRCRFNRESGSSQQKFLELHNFRYKSISEEEKEQCRKELIDSTFSIRLCQSKLDNKEFFIYKVPFIEVLDLISSRKVLVKNGHAYIPQPDLISVIVNTYKTKLSHALTITMRALPALEEDERLLPLVSGLSDRYVGKDYGSNNDNPDAIMPHMVDELSKKSFPLCMRILHETFRRDHHLKHGSRLQYGLFLKGIGMTLEGVLEMWRAEFTKLIDADKFDKQYAYGIRHNFGKEGKRANYTPYSCTKIITTNTPGPGDTHGCPFRHSSKTLLEQRLKGNDIHDSDIQRIMELVNQGNYQMACSQYFESTHKSADVEISINHPNQYFSESTNIRQGKTSSDAKPKVKTTRSVMYNKGSSTTSNDNVDDTMLRECGITSDELDDIVSKAEQMIE